MRRGCTETPPQASATGALEGGGAAWAGAPKWRDLIKANVVEIRGTGWPAAVGSEGRRRVVGDRPHPLGAGDVQLGRKPRRGQLPVPLRGPRGSTVDQ